MEPELPYQRNCLACFMPQISGMLTTGQNNPQTGPTAPLCPKELFAKIRKQLATRLMTIGLKLKIQFRINITMLLSAPIEIPSFYLCNCSPSLFYKYPLPVFPNLRHLPEIMIPKELFFMVSNKCLLPHTLKGLLHFRLTFALQLQDDLIIIQAH